MRHREELSDVAIRKCLLDQGIGLPRYARNDDETEANPARQACAMLAATTTCFNVA